MPLGPDDLPAERFAQLLHGITPSGADVVHRFSAISRFRNSEGAAEVYASMTQPAELLWVITALGEDADALARVRTAIAGVTGEPASRIIRDLVPWHRAWELFNARRIELIKTQSDEDTDVEFIDVVRGMFGEFD